jgi:hypothetical protein
MNHQEQACAEPRKLLTPQRIRIWISLFGLCLLPAFADAAPQDPCAMAALAGARARALCEAALAGQAVTKSQNRAAAQDGPANASGYASAPNPPSGPPPKIKPGFTRINVIGNLFVDVPSKSSTGGAGQWSGMGAPATIPVTQTWYVNKGQSRSTIQQPTLLVAPDRSPRAQFGFNYRDRTCFADITGADGPVLLTETPQTFRLSDLHMLTPNRVTGCPFTNTVNNFSGTITLSADSQGDVSMKYALNVYNAQGIQQYLWESADYQYRNGPAPEVAAGGPNGGRAPSNAAPARGGLPTQAPRPTAAATPDNGPYRSDKFSGLTVFRQMFDQAAHSPAEFAKNQANMANAAKSGTAIANTIAFPKRSDLQKVATDYEYYTLYYRNPEKLYAKQNECLQPRDYSPEEACDCLAGFPGDTLIGPGAGELVISSNHTAAVKACGVAAANASTPALKARYTAQRARAQVPTTDPAQAMTWADEAIAAGYKRALITKAEGNLWDVEFRSSGFPPMTRVEFSQTMQEGVDHLKAAKKAGVLETYIVARKYQQQLDASKLSDAVMTPIIKSMLAPPPKTPCGPDDRGSDGKPITGTGCIGHSFN